MVRQHKKHQIKRQDTDIKNFSSFKKKLQKYLNDYQIKQIEKAYNIAFKAHEGQVRKSGEAYIEHPLSAATYLSNFQLDHETIMAAILHDVIEDTQINMKILKQEFGAKVSQLVDGVSKLDKINFSSKEEADAANLRKMILAMSQDIRVILIKLADRIHNLETISVLKIQQQKKIAKETLEIYAPIALRLGIHNMTIQMEDLAFKSLYPIRFKILQNFINEAQGNRKELMKKIKKVIEEKLTDEGLNAEVLAREKHVYGIYKKMKQKELKFSQIHDIFGVRIITSNVDDCYRVLGVIHNSYTPIPGRFKDYIAIPKSNGYQSLHTEILGPHGLPTEFQIRTKDMDILAQTGIAAHWFYKIGDKTTLKDYTKEQQWIANLLDIQENSGNPKEYLQSIKADLYPGKVYVFSPKGDIIELPKKSTVIDYAYAIHTDLGNKFASAKIDNKTVSPNTIVKNGQLILITTKKDIKPNPGWLNFAVTEKARHSIRASLKLIQREDATNFGKKLLIHMLEEFNLKIKDIPAKTLKIVLEEYNCSNIEDLYREIGLGNRIPKLVAMRIAPTSDKKKSSDHSQGVNIEGTEGLIVSYAKCCFPIPGDTILGYTSQGKGIVVHQQTCKSIKGIKSKKEQIIDLSWGEDTDDVFNACVKVEVKNKRGVLAQISSIIAQNNSNIESVTYGDTKETGHNIMVFVISINHINALSKLMSKLRKNVNVISVDRKRS
tara:strand:+ start:5593 stop:7752 length:2160 start_codon:yes stop_codon:yes gene_type:complete